MPNSEVLSADEIEILEYLKSWKGTYVSLVEVCRSAGGRQRYKDSPNWANPFMSRLVEANLAEGNDRGHFRYVEEEPAAPPETANPAPQNAAVIVGDDYFPSISSDDEDQQRWMAPHIAEILKNGGKKPGGQQA